MSVLFVFGSEEEFRVGAAWCRRIMDAQQCSVNLLVLGSDRTTLVEQAKRKGGEYLGLDDNGISVESVEMKVESVIAYGDLNDSSTLLMVYQANDRAFQQSLFERCKHSAVWVHARGDGSETSSLRIAAVGDDGLSSKLSERSLGILPSDTIAVDTTASSEQSSVLQPSDVTDIDMILIGINKATDSDPTYRWARKQIAQSPPPGFVLIHSGDTIAENAAGKIRNWFASVAPPMDREERIVLASDLEAGSKPNLEFLGLISASAMLAAFGLLQNSAAVIIGAMLIAPLMTPIMGAGLGLAHGNRPLFQSSLVTITLGFVGALVASMSFGWLYWIFKDPLVTDEMWARCNPSPLDFCVGLVGGLAASYARTRAYLSSALAGAAIAAALVPPLSTAGLQIAFGLWQPSPRGLPIVGPILLVSVNVLTIMVGSSFILWARGMRNETKFDSRTRWSLRMMALLVAISLLALVWITH